MERVEKEILLQVTNASLVFGDKVILRPINIAIKDIVGHGQVVGLLGPSGIGKTQFFRVLSGFQKPTTGEVTIVDGLQKPIPVRPGLVGVVAQSYPLFRHRTVQQNLVMAAKARGLDGKAALEQSMEFLKRFQLQDHLQKFPAQLSGGQRQRIAIAQQLLCSEHYLLMDEPFSGLDPVMLDEVCRMIQEVADINELNTIIVITHDIRAAVKVADTLWIMGRDRDEKGNIIPGAYVKYFYDLVERGLAWHPNVSDTPEFNTFAHEIKDLFRSL